MPIRHTDLETAAASAGVDVHRPFPKERWISSAPVFGGPLPAVCDWKFAASQTTVATLPDAVLLSGLFPLVGDDLVVTGMHNDAEARVSAKPPRLEGVRESLGGPCFLLGGHPDNFWHFLYNFVLRLAALVAHPDPEVRDGARILVDDALPSSFRPFLHLFGHDPARFLAIPSSRPVRVERLVVSELPFFRPHGRPRACRGAIALLRRHLPADRPPRGRRIYLSRADARWRRVANEAEVAAFLESRGFETVLLSRMEPMALVALMRAAEVVVGPSGANLGAALFCPQDAAVIELSYEPMARAYYFQGASSAGGLRHLKVVGRPEPSGEPSHRWAFHAPVPALADALAFALG